MHDHEEEDEQNTHRAREERLTEEGGTKCCLHLRHANLSDREWERTKLKNGDEACRLFERKAATRTTTDLPLAARDRTLDVRS